MTWCRGREVQDRKILCLVVDASIAITYTTDNNTIKQHVTCDSVRVEMCECSFTRLEPEQRTILNSARMMDVLQ